MSAYERVHQRSLRDPGGFWGEAAAMIHWDKKWERVLDFSSPPFYRWFVGGELNTCYNALDRHVEAGRGNQLALIYDSPVTGSIRKLTYKELLDLVSRFAGVLASLGVAKGDTVVVYMPMIPEVVVVMLACARIGAIHSVVFGGFAPRELAIRIDDARPRIVVSASCGIEGSKVIPYKPLLDSALQLAQHKPRHCIIVQRAQAKADLHPGRDLDWSAQMYKSAPEGCVTVKATDPLYILYTSGTTGVPKGVVRDNGGHAVALRWTMKYLYGIEPGEVFWAASDVGWVVGHSYIVYAPLLTGATTVMYEGKPVGTPDAGAFWRVVSQHNVRALFTAPTAIRAIKREDPRGDLLKKYDLTHFRTLFLAGERTDPDTYHWAAGLLKKPVIDHWWQTETAWAITANFAGLGLFPVKPGSANRPSPGYDVRVVDPEGRELPPNQHGVIVVKLPLPPGCFGTLWRNERQFKESYMDPFPGYYLTGDGGYIDEEGYVFVMDRIDTVINVAGHRLSTGAMEEILAEHPDVAECAVVGAHDQLKGQVPVGFVVLKAGVARPNDIIAKELVASVREKIGAVASFKQVAIVKRLPKTRSGKVLRGTIRKIADGAQYTVPSTIDDPAILGEFEEAVKTIGYGKR